MNTGKDIVESIKTVGTPTGQGIYFERSGIGDLLMRETLHFRGRDVVIEGQLENGTTFHLSAYKEGTTIQYLANYRAKGEDSKPDLGMCIDTETGQPSPSHQDISFEPLWRERDLVIAAIIKILNG